MKQRIHIPLALVMTIAAVFMVALSLSGSTVTHAATCPATPGVSYSRSAASTRTCTNLAPSYVLNDLYDRCENDHWGSWKSAWLSQSGQPSLQTISVPYNATSTNIQLNMMTFRCYPNIGPDSIAGKTLIQNTSNLVPLRNKVYDTPFVGAGTVGYRISSFNDGTGANSPKTVTVTFPAITSDTTLKYYLNSKGTLEKDSGDRYKCALVGGEPQLTISSLTDFGPCATDYTAYYIYLKVQAPQWSITGTTTRTTGATITPGGTIQWTHSVSNSGPDRATSTINSQVEQSTDGGATWTSVGSATDSPNPARGTFWSGPGSYATTIADAGKTICQRVRFTPRSSTGDTGYSTPQCAKVVMPPETSSVQVWGSNFYTGGDAVGAFRIPRDGDPSGSYYGSWVEYGILSTGRNTNIASAAGLNGGSTSLQSDWSKLTFANTSAARTGCSTGQYGCWGAVPDTTALVDTLSSRCSFGGDQSIGPWTITDTQYVCSNGTVTVNGNINYANSGVGNPGGIPQLIVIAKNIVIAKDVSNVDAWLITKATAPTDGNISTCNAISGFHPFSEITLSESTCPTPLVINGPIIANHLYLYRTTKLTASDNPAERLDFRADAYLWAYAGGGSGDDSVAQTVSVRELPPRF